MNLNQGWKCAEAIRKAIKLGTDPTITVSCGISYWEACTNPKETQENLFLRADQALYQAKTDGKNQIAAF